MPSSPCGPGPRSWQSTPTNSIAEQLQGLSISTPRLKLKPTPITGTAQGASVPPQQTSPVGPAHAAAAAAAAAPPHTPTQNDNSRVGQPSASGPARGAVAGEKRDRASGREDSLLLSALGGGGSSSRSGSQGVAPKRRVLLPAEHEQSYGG